MGVAMLAVGIGIAVALLVAGVDRWWRLGVVLPFWMGALGVFQAQARI